LRAELVKLSGLLQERYGIEESQHNLSNKIRRGKLSAVCLGQLLVVIDCDNIDISGFELR
jgi:hypothetical protein